MIQDILIKAMISSFCKSMYFIYFSFLIKRVARWGCDFFSLTSLTNKKVRVFLIYLLKIKQVLLKIKSLPLKTIRGLQRILTICVKLRSYQQLLQIFAESRRWRTAVFQRGAHFLEPTCLPKKRIPFLQNHRILATMLMAQYVLMEEIICSFWENIYFELFSFSYKSVI